MAEEEVSSLLKKKQKKKNPGQFCVFVCDRWGLVEWAKSLI